MKNLDKLYNYIKEDNYVGYNYTIIYDNTYGLLICFNEPIAISTEYTGYITARPLIQQDIFSISKILVSLLLSINKNKIQLALNLIE